MPRPRKQLVCVSDTPYYHVMSRCVRRAFLCGVDEETGRSYEHRRDWIESRIRLLSSLFSIHVGAYAVMSNHYHLVVKLTPGEAQHWSDDDVLERWCSLFKGTTLIQRYRAGEELDAVQMTTVRDTLGVYRKRLTDLSWFMKCLNEPIARMANKEDGCSGHFWEARFESRAIRSEAALLMGLVYVDLNPIRAGIASTPETSEYTSIRQRLRKTAGIPTAIQEMLSDGDLRAFGHPIRPLMPFSDDKSLHPHSIPMPFKDYLELLDSTGRISRPHKKGSIGPEIAPILERLDLSESAWLEGATNFEDMHRRRRLPGARTTQAV